ncbi:MAG: hypothetical protein ACK5P6_07745, partial [Pseudobdellovibrionaceae bacterium]
MNRSSPKNQPLLRKTPADKKSVSRRAAPSKARQIQAPKQLGLSPQFEKKFSDRFGGSARTTRASRGQR